MLRLTQAPCAATLTCLCSSQPRETHLHEEEEEECVYVCAFVSKIHDYTGGISVAAQADNNSHILCGEVTSPQYFSTNKCITKVNLNIKCST